VRVYYKLLFAHLFDGVKAINSIKDGKKSISGSDLKELKSLYNTFVFDVLGFTREEEKKDEGSIADEEIERLLKERHDAKLSKNWGTADRIRDELINLGITIKDTKDGATWER
jgi:cysteinyl-tRNA synthetase